MTLGLAGIGRIVFDSGRLVQKVDGIEEKVDGIDRQVEIVRGSVELHAAELRLARLDREEVEKTLAEHNARLDRRTDEMLRRLNALERQGESLGGGR